MADDKIDNGEEEMKRTSLTLVVPFKFGQSKKSNPTRFPTVLTMPSGTTPASPAKRPKVAYLNTLAGEQLTLVKK